MFKSDFVGLFFPLSYPFHLGCGGSSIAEWSSKSMILLK